MGRATVITASKGVTYKMLSPNIQASDVAEDGRAMLLSIAAAVGFPEMIFTSDYSNANYSSSLIAQNPFVREIEDWQDYFVTFYKNIFRVVIQNAIDFGPLPKGTDLKCRVEFPPMIAADIEQMSKAFEILYKYKIISVKTWRGKMGLDDDIEKANQEDEDDIDTMFGNPTGQPADKNPNVAKGDTSGKFNLPISPTNQFSANFNEAIENEDWDELEELCESIGGIPEDAAVKLLASTVRHNDNKDEEIEQLREEIQELKESRKIVIENHPAENNIDVNVPEREVIVNQGDIKTGDTIINESEKKINLNVEPAKVENIVKNKIENKIEQPDVKIENKIENKIEQPNVTVENKIEPIIELKPEMKVVLEEKKRNILKKVKRDKDGKVIEIEESEK